jgi:ATP-binding cassette subfamily F protein 3
MLRINSLTFRIGGRTLFDRAEAHVPAGHKVGLVGRNGTGKTTLLGLIVGRRELDGGSIRLRSNSRVGMIAQEAPEESLTALEAVLAADTRRASLLEESSVCQDPKRIAEIHTELVDIGAHSAPARAASILAGLGFDEQDQSRRLSSFSGGLQMRVALAQALFSEPDLLLLDEPTNHLDLESTVWLESYLGDYPNTLIVVSHDRGLLTNSVDHILHLSGQKLEMVRGGYDNFERAVSARQTQNDALRKKQEAAKKRIIAFVDRFRAKNTKARQAQSRLKALERMAPIAAVTDDRHVEFSFPRPSPTSSPLLRMDQVSIGYEPGKPVLSCLNQSIFALDRIALLGANGNGKTTLARLIAGRLEPSSGRIFKTSKLKAGYFSQDRLEQLEPGLNALEHASLYMPDCSPTEVRSVLGGFGLGKEKIDVPVSGLSGGEKTRLALALTTIEKPNLLILDEPTNHLDMDSRKALIEALLEYEGAAVLISHDRHLVEAASEQLWLVSGGRVDAFFGDIDDYRALLLENKRAGHAHPAPNAEKKDRRDERRLRAEARARLAPLQRKVDEAEATFEALLNEKRSIDDSLSSPSTYVENADAVSVLFKQRRKLENKISLAEEDWLEAQAALEKQLLLEKAAEDGHKSS